MACEAEGDLEAASIAWGALAEADALVEERMRSEGVIR